MNHSRPNKKARIGRRNEELYKMLSGNIGGCDVQEETLRADETPIGLVAADPEPKRLMVASMDVDGELIIYPINFSEQGNSMEPGHGHQWVTRVPLKVNGEDDLSTNVQTIEGIHLDINIESLRIATFDKVNSAKRDTYMWRDYEDMVTNPWLQRFGTLCRELQEPNFLMLEDHSQSAVAKAISDITLSLGSAADETKVLFELLEETMNNKSDTIRLHGMNCFIERYQALVSCLVLDLLSIRKDPLLWGRKSNLKLGPDVWDALGISSDGDEFRITQFPETTSFVDARRQAGADNLLSDELQKFLKSRDPDLQVEPSHSESENNEPA